MVNSHNGIIFSHTQEKLEKWGLKRKNLLPEEGDFFFLTHLRNMRERVFANCPQTSSQTVHGRFTNCPRTYKWITGHIVSAVCRFCCELCNTELGTSKEKQ